jgi:hypothetical protein
VQAIGLPLRVDRNGQLGRADAVDTLLQLVRAMAGTTADVWPHAPWFGLYEHFAGANLGLEDQQGLADALNLAFAKLGVDWARVHTVKTASRRALGERRFDITILVEGEEPVHGQVTT